MSPETAQLVQTIVSPLLESVALGVASWGISVFQQYTGIKFTADQRAVMQGAIETGVGQLRTKLAQGMSIQDVRIDDPNVLAIARGTVDAVPGASSTMDMTEARAARTIVGKFGNLHVPAVTGAAPPASASTDVAPVPFTTLVRTPT